MKIDRETINNGKAIAKLEENTNELHKKFDRIDTKFDKFGEKVDVMIGKFSENETRQDFKIGQLEDRQNKARQVHKELELFIFMARNKWTFGVAMIIAILFLVKEFRDMFLDKLF